MGGPTSHPQIECVTVFPLSPFDQGGTRFFLGQRDGGGSKVLGVEGDSRGFAGVADDTSGVLLCPLTAANAAALRDRVPWLRPTLLGLTTSAGFGDRLGLATPGHVRSIRQTPGGTSAIAPIFAQQSVRENARTGRTPLEVMNDATWGVLQEGWQAPWGADADHLKTTADVDAFADAGFTFFTIDPGDHVDDAADGLGSSALEEKLDAAPWAALEDSPADLQRRYPSGTVSIDGQIVPVDRPQLLRAVAKYGNAIAHTAAMYRYIAARMGAEAFELEVSVDETASPTTVFEHLYIVRELTRLGVSWVSLAPRFVGSFEKGVDYIGDIEAFTAELALHAAVARTHGPYKLSLHSGSDKFAIYPLVARLTAGAQGSPLAHVKTAGTSYLEALRATAEVDPDLFRTILGLAIQRYETDRATYHVSARLRRVGDPERASDDELPSFLSSFDARQVLHVTFGSILDTLGERLRLTLARHQELYTSLLAAHFEKHLRPFVRPGAEGS